MIIVIYRTLMLQIVTSNAMTINQYVINVIISLLGYVSKHLSAFHCTSQHLSHPRCPETQSVVDGYNGNSFITRVCAVARCQRGESVFFLI